MTNAVMALAAFWAITSLHSTGGSWTSKFDSRSKVLAQSEDREFLPVSIEIAPKGGMKIQHGTVTRVIRDQHEVTRFAALMQKDDRDCIVVVFEAKHGPAYSYRWLSFSLNRQTMTLSERASGDIILATDELDPIAVSLFADNLSVDLQETQKVAGNRASLMLRFSHRCLANGITGVLERHYVSAEDLDVWLSKIKDLYPRDYGLQD